MKHICIALLLAAFASSAWAGTLRGAAHVVDGDTIDVADERVRIQGLDTPERGQKCLDAAGAVYRCGKAATEALKSLIGDAPVRCELEPERGRYGRAIGTCFTSDGVDVADWLIRNGLGLAYRKYSLRYVAAEEEAISARRGMHAGSFVAPWDWRKGKR